MSPRLQPPTQDTYYDYYYKWEEYDSLLAAIYFGDELPTEDFSYSWLPIASEGIYWDWALDADECPG